MNNDSESRQLEVEVQILAAEIRTLANRYQGNSLALLALLRALEQVHREIQDNLFQASLPDNRQALYAFLRNIEETGGWPYIERLKLRSLLSNLLAGEIQTTDMESDD